MDEELISEIETTLGVEGFDAALDAIYAAYGEERPAEPSDESNPLAENPDPPAEELRRDIQLRRKLSARGMSRKEFELLKKNAVRRVPRKMA